jgi:hypothetical protein
LEPLSIWGRVSPFIHLIGMRSSVDKSRLKAVSNFALISCDTGIEKYTDPLDFAFISSFADNTASLFKKYEIK